MTGPEPESWGPQGLDLLGNCIIHMGLISSQRINTATQHTDKKMMFTPQQGCMLHTLAEQAVL